MRLHIACGDTYLDGWVNIDLRDDCRTDLQADCLQPLPFPDGSVDEILASDFLEHIPPNRTDAVLADWRRLLRDDGELMVRVPNLLAISEHIVKYRDDPDRCALLIRNIYGGHRWGTDGSLDAHHQGWTPDLLKRLFDRNGFQIFSYDQALNFTARAAKHVLVSW